MNSSTRAVGCLTSLQRAQKVVFGKGSSLEEVLEELRKIPPDID
jgi:hypothetical protein